MIYFFPKPFFAARLHFTAEHAETPLIVNRNEFVSMVKWKVETRAHGPAERCEFLNVWPV